jgi:hypothetical protein
MNPFQRVTIYGPEIIQAYSGRRRGDLEPHLFAIAEDAYTAMRKDGTGQTIIVSGERSALRHVCGHLLLISHLQWCWKDRVGTQNIGVLYVAPSSFTIGETHHEILGLSQLGF